MTPISVPGPGDELFHDVNVRHDKNNSYDEVPFYPRHTRTKSAPRDRDQSHDKYLSPEMDLGHERDKQS
jgi:hypothetical protein